MSATESLTYEKACEAHRWQLPDRYNIAAEVCDRQPSDRTAMVFEDFRGNRREVSWAEQQSLANRAANLLASRGVERGDGSRSAPRLRPRRRRCSWAPGRPARFCSPSRSSTATRESNTASGTPSRG